MLVCFKGLHDMQRLFVPWCCQCCMRIKVSSSVASSKKRKGNVPALRSSWSWISTLLRKLSNRSHMLMQQKWNHKGFLVCTCSYASCQQKHCCPFASFIKFADRLLAPPPKYVCIYKKWFSHVHIRKVSFLLQSKTCSCIAAVVLYFTGLFTDCSIKICLGWLCVMMSWKTRLVMPKLEMCSRLLKNACLDSCVLNK